MEPEADPSRLPPALRVALAGVATLVMAVVFGLAARSKMDSFQCRNNPLSDIASPDAARRAVSFVRECGRGVPSSTQVAVLLPAQPFASDQLGNVFVAELEREAELQLSWSAPDELEIRIGAVRRAYRADTQLEAIRVRYRTLP